MSNVPEVGNIVTPIVLAEELLTDQIFSGSITFQNRFSIDGKQLDTPHTYTRPFLITSNFGFSLGNTWKSLIPTEGTEFLSSMYNLLSMINFENFETHNIAFVSKAMSALSWKGSANPEFSVDMIFVATQRTYNPVDIIKELAMTCLPTKLRDAKNEGAQNAKKLAGDAIKNVASVVSESLDWWGNLAGGSKDNPNILNSFAQSINKGGANVGNIIEKSGLMSPLEYKVVPDYDNDEAFANGTVTLAIGRWFRASSLVVKNMSNIEFSKETIAPRSQHISKQQRIYDGVASLGDNKSWGFPLFAKCQLTLTPITPITYDQFTSYFIDPAANETPYDNAIRVQEESNIQAQTRQQEIINKKDKENPNKTGEVQ